MNASAVLGLFSAAIALAAAGVALRLQRLRSLPGAGWFGLVGICSALYAAGNHASTLPLGADAILWISRAQLAAAILLSWGWVRFHWTFLGLSPPRLERLAAWALLALSGFALLPGVVFVGPVTLRPTVLLDAVYREVSTTPLGNAIVAAPLVAAALLLERLGRSWRAGVRHARALTLGFAFLVALGLNDALAVTGALDAPYLLGIGLLGPVVAFAWSFSARYVESRLALEALSRELEAKVEDRTRDLAAALGALHQAERLAALGQFASGVAHEVNSPAAAVLANLRFVEQGQDGQSCPEEHREALRDAIEAMERIQGLVRRLVDAGRTASSTGSLANLPVHGLVEDVAREARARAPANVRIHTAVPAALVARAQREPLLQALGGLVANAVEAIPPGRPGSVEIHVAGNGGATIRLEIRDDGAGMSPDVLRKAFDPFFTTKSDTGRGLGLPVAKGLLEGHGGSLRIRSEPGVGTVATVELPAAPEPSAGGARGGLS